MGQRKEEDKEQGEDGWRRRKEGRGRLSWEGGPSAAGCRNVSHACPLDDLASPEWEILGVISLL